MVKIIIAAAGGLGLGAFLGSLFTKKKYEAEIERICQECTEETNELAEKLRALKRHFVDNAPLEQAQVNADAWKKISEQHKKELEELNAPVNEEITPHKKPDWAVGDDMNPNTDIMRPNQTESPNYADIYKPVDDARSIKEGVDALVKKINNDHEDIAPAVAKGPNGELCNTKRWLYCDDYLESDDSMGFDEVWLSYYPEYHGGCIYNEEEDRWLPDSEVPDYTGKTIEQVRDIFTNHANEFPNENHEWSIINEEKENVFVISACYSRPPIIE